MRPEDPLTKVAKEWGPIGLTVVGTLAAFGFYQHYLRRFPTSANVQESFFRRRTLFGKATSVGDGDGFHLFHTPGGRLAGWGWLRRIPKTRTDRKGQTIPIRLAGVDAPEGAHFGRPGQPGAAEALTFLSDYILNRRVRAQIYKRDQYNRIVATVYVRRFLFKKDVGLEMLKQGLATVYEAKSGVEWGGQKEVYEAAEAQAKAKKLGIWSGKQKDFESPRAYKSKIQDVEKARDTETKTTPPQVVKSWWRRWIS